jgi:ethanolamine utilization protein EutP (predicted NTPase)
MATPLYQSLTAQSTPDQIAAAYSQFAQAAGGDTQSAQTQAVDFLTKLGISAPTITQAYEQYLAPVATPTFTPTATVTTAPVYFQQNPDVAAAFQQNSYGLTPEQFAATHYEKYGANEQRAAPTSAPILTPTATVTADSAPLYQGLTAQSTPQQIAAAYAQFADAAGGDTQSAQTQAVDFLTNLGISAPTITQAYEAYRSPQGLTGDIDPYAYAYEYGVANNDFSGLLALLQQTPDSTSLISKYNLTPEQINQIEFGTGFDLDQSGGYGAGKVGNDWNYNSYLDALREGDTDTALSMYRSADPLGAQRLENMYQELLQQQTVTGDNWAAGNLGSKDAAALDFALRLMENGVGSIYDLGQRTVEKVVEGYNGPEIQQDIEYFNKETGEALPDWARVASGNNSGSKLN